MNHSWKFCTRRDVEAAGLEIVVPERFKSATPNPLDCVALTKQDMSAQTLSQTPFIVMPWDLASSKKKLFDTTIVEPQPDNPKCLPKQMADAYRSTAKLVRAEPWSMTRAANYLESLCGPAPSGVPYMISELLFLKSDLMSRTRLCCANAHTSEMDLDNYVPLAPRHIHVKRGPVAATSMTEEQNVPDIGVDIGVEKASEAQGGDTADDAEPELDIAANISEHESTAKEVATFCSKCRFKGCARCFLELHPVVGLTLCSQTLCSSCFFQMCVSSDR